MINNIEIARNLGYLTIPDDMIINIKNCFNYPDNEIVLLTTGSQGEPMAALTRMAREIIIISTSGRETQLLSLLRRYQEMNALLVRPLISFIKRVLRLSMKIYPEFMYLAMPARKN